MKYLALALLLFGLHLIKRAILSKSCVNGSFLLGVLGLLCIVIGLITFLVLIFLAL